MEDGIYYDIPDADYHALPYISNSKLLKLRKSQEFFKYSLDNPESSTDAMRFGTAFHTCVLQKDIFDRDYAILPIGDGRTKEVKLARENCIARYGEKALKADDYGTIIAMDQRLQENEITNRLLTKRSATELTLIWTDIETGVKCKGRIDGLCEEDSLAFDLKTSSDASLGGFTHSVVNYAYHRQAAFYLSGLEHLGKTIKHFLFIAIEKEPPYGLGLYIISNDDIALGRVENQNALAEYKQCVESDTWSGYNSDKIAVLELPAYYRNKLTK